MRSEQLPSGIQNVRYIPRAAAPTVVDRDLHSGAMFEYDEPAPYGFTEYPKVVASVVVESRDEENMVAAAGSFDPAEMRVRLMQERARRQTAEIESTTEVVAHRAEYPKWLKAPDGREAIVHDAGEEAKFKNAFSGAPIAYMLGETTRKVIEALAEHDGISEGAVIDKAIDAYARWRQSAQRIARPDDRKHQRRPGSRSSAP